RAGVKHFIFVSFAPVSVDFELQRAKRAVESDLRTSGMTFTIIQPVNFMEVWLSPALGFDPLGGKVRIFGSGEQPVSWVSLQDVARVCAQSVDNPRVANQ